jgi:chromosome segregation ATPase
MNLTNLVDNIGQKCNLPKAELTDLPVMENAGMVTSHSSGALPGSHMSEHSVTFESLLKERDLLKLKAELENLEMRDLLSIAVERLEQDIVVQRPLRFIHVDKKMTDVFINEENLLAAGESCEVRTYNSSSAYNACTSKIVVGLISELVGDQSIGGPCKQCGTLYTELHEKIYQLQVELEDMHAEAGTGRATSPGMEIERVENDVVKHVKIVDFGVTEISDVTKETEVEREQGLVTVEDIEAVIQIETVEATQQGVDVPACRLSEEVALVIIAELKMMVEILETKQKDLLRHLEASNREKQCLQKQLTENVQKLNDWENIMIAQKDDHGNFLAELVKSEERERRLGKEIEDITHSLHDALQERDRLRDDLCKMLDKDGHLLDEINGLKKQLEEIGAEKSRIERDIEEIKVLNSTNEAEVYNLQHELELVTKMKEELEEMQQRSKDESAELMEKEAISLTQTSQYRSEIESLMSERENLKMKLEIVEKEKLSMMEGGSDEVKVLLEKVEVLNAECTELRGQVAESVHFEEMEKQLAGESERFLGDLENLKKDLADLEQEKGSYLAEIELLRSNLKEVEAERQGYKSGVESLKLALEDLLGEKKTQDDEMEKRMDYVAQLKVEVDELNAEIKELQVELHDRNRQISDLQDDLDRKVTESRSEVSEFEAEMKEMRSDIHHRNEELCGVKNENEELQSRLVENETREIAELGSELKGLQTELRHRNEELADRKFEIDNLLEQLECRHDEVLGRESRIRELEDVISHHKQEMELMRADVEKLRCQGEGSLDELGKTKDAEIEVLQQRLDMVEAEREGLRQEKLMIETEVGGLKESLGRMEKERDCLNVDLKEFKCEMGGLGNRYQTAEEDLKELSQQVKVVETERDGLMQTLEQSSADVAGLQEKLEMREKLFEELRRKAFKMQQMLKELKTKQVEWKEKEGSLVGQVEVLKEGRVEKLKLEERMEHLKDENAKLLERLREVSVERQSLHKAADSSQSMNSKFKERVTSFEEEVSKLRENIQQLNDEKQILERSKMAEGELQLVLASLEKEKRDLNLERNDLKDQVEQANQKVSNLGNELEPLNEEVSNLRMANRAAEEELQAMQTSFVDKQSQFDHQLVHLADQKQHLLEQLDDLRLEVETRKSREVDILRKSEVRLFCRWANVGCLGAWLADLACI